MRYKTTPENFEYFKDRCNFWQEFFGLISWMILACPICNEVKGRILTRKEMFEIGLVLQKNWEQRLKEEDYATD